MNDTQNKLPQELTALVNYSLKILGESIQLEYGDAVFKEVEFIRKHYKSVRSSSLSKKLEAHQILTERLKKKKPQEKLQIAHSFAASLELINACENAYRSHRLGTTGPEKSSKPAEPIIFVLTAHPTEARSTASIHILNELSKILRVQLEQGELSQDLEKHMRHYILLLVKTLISKPKSPTVQDEADYIYSIVLKPETIDLMCQYYGAGQPVYFRTWVGGDKDGHPGVNEKVMLKSLSLARKKLLPIIKANIDRCHKELGLVSTGKKKAAALQKKILSLSAHLGSLRTVGPGDGIKIKRFYKTLESVASQYLKIMGIQSPEIEKIGTILKVFPGLVIPLEIREDSAVIKQATDNPRLEIAKMLKSLRSIAKGGEVIWYARGFIISMCESQDDVRAALKLAKQQMGQLTLPIVPLFETRKALESSTALTEEFLSIPEFKKALDTVWNKKYEVMLGYSDSAKESGALFSRVTILKTLNDLDKLIRSKAYVPIFFHGSGGSVARGGGSLKKQISWWPKTAQLRFKATIQGEMIHRTFSSSEILSRQISKIRTYALKEPQEKLDPKSSDILTQLAELNRLEYLNKVEDPVFMKVVEKATPYSFLDQLRIGSRPSKRKSEFNLKNLRAIPWVLCWTQTRTLFPVWWGLGSSWEKLTPEQKSHLVSSFQTNGFFKSFVEILAYTIAKVDLSVWGHCLEQADILPGQKEQYLKEFKDELGKVQNFVFEVSGQDKLLYFTPWLRESIDLRSTLIYPLNILELDAMQRNDIPLMRESVTGIASGMLTTG